MPRVETRIDERGLKRGFAACEIKLRRAFWFKDTCAGERKKAAGLE
jgi:hypothetical protein